MSSGKCKAVMLSLSGSDTSEVENLEMCNIFWERQGEKCLSSATLVQMK